VGNGRDGGISGGQTPLAEPGLRPWTVRNGRGGDRPIFAASTTLKGLFGNRWLFTLFLPSLNTFRSSFALWRFAKKLFP
jgi:hypothetical protein